MRNILILFILLLVYSFSQAQSLNWATSAGSVMGNARTETGRAVSSDAEGNIYVAGSFRDTAYFGSVQVISFGTLDVFLAKYDRRGQLIWIQTGGGAGDDVCLDMATDAAGNSYLTGYFQDTATFALDTLIARNTTHAFFLKYDSQGQLLWSRQAGNDQVAGPSFFSPYGFFDGGTSVALDPAGYCYFNGFFPQTISFGTDTLEFGGMYLAKFDTAGHPVWAVKAGDTPNFGHLAALGMSVTQDHDVLLTGPFQSQVNFGGGNLIFTTGIEAFIARYDSSGTIKWARQAGGSNFFIPPGGGEWIYTTGYDIDSDGAGNAYITGRTIGNGDFDTLSTPGPSASIDFFLTRYDIQGRIQWLLRSDTVLAAAGHAGLAIETDTEGNSIMSGYFTNFAFIDSSIISSPNANNRDILLLKCAPDGSITWLTQYGGLEDEEAMALGVDKFGDLNLSGFFADSSQFDTLQLHAVGEEDIYLAKVADCNQQITISGQDTFCLSDSLRLSVPDGTGMSFQWYKDSMAIAGANTASLAPELSGNYYVILNASGCSDTAREVSIVALAQPPRPALALVGDSVFCDGDSALLIGPSGWAAYDWNRGDTSQTIWVRQSGSFQLRVIDSLGCKSIYSSSQSILNHPNPAKPLLSGPMDSSFCKTDSLLLSGPSGFTQYAWSNGASTQEIVLSQSGMYSLVVTDSNDCVSQSSDTSRVIVFGIPQAPGIMFLGDTTAFCEDDPQPLTASTGYLGYRWSSGDTARSILVDSTGHYAVIGIDSNNCPSAYSDSIYLIAHIIPSKPGILSLPGDSLRSTVGGTVYFWFVNNTQLPVGTRTIKASQSGTYEVIVSNEGCFSEISDPYGYNVTGLEKQLLHQLVIYPNPTSGNFYVKGENLPVGTQNIVLMDTQGKLIWQKEVDILDGSLKQEFMLEGLSKGLYILRMGNTAKTLWVK